jgi:phosphoribosyl 1,2-cyclic phosphate phosphodiesterase
MKLTFLGTSAGESYPAIWCDCENCTYAREHGGKNIRMNTGSMIDDDILLDMNSCGFYTAARLGVSLTKVKHLIVTHPHDDHLTTAPLGWRRAAAGVLEAQGEEKHKMFSPRFTKIPVLTVYGNLHTRKLLVDEHPELFMPEMCSQFQDIKEGVRVDAGDGLSFIPVAAIHGGDGKGISYDPEKSTNFAHSYIIERGGKRLLYALDTGGFVPEMMDLILSHKYDGVVMEGTFGLNDTPQTGHMNTQKNIEFRDMLIEKGCISAETPFFLTHMAPHWTPPYDIYAPMMAEKGITVAYDGMVAEI